MTCLNGNGDPVDWWVVLKLPGGTRYSYGDSVSTAALGTLVAAPATLDSPTGPVGRTLGVLMSARGDDSTTRVNWNDIGGRRMLFAEEEEVGVLLDRLLEEDEEADEGLSRRLGTTDGHTNGVIGANATGGFLLSHSWPGFPDLNSTDPSTFSTSPASPIYGQSMFCVSLSPAMVESAATGLAYLSPLMVDTDVPSTAAAQYPILASVVTGFRSYGTRVANLTTPNGFSVTQFSKSGSWGGDLYSGLIQPTLGFDMYAETWLRSPVMASYCPPNQTCALRRRWRS